VVVGGKGENGPPLRLAFGAREGERVWWWLVKVKWTLSGSLLERGRGQGWGGGGKGENGPLRLALKAREGLG
jgi:hypothetical protein